MPDTIRASGGGFAGPRRSGFGRWLGAAAAAFPAVARADDLPPDVLLQVYLDALTTFERHELAALALSLGVIAFAVLTAIALVRTRARAAKEKAAARSEIAALRDMSDRANALLFAEPQIVVVWPAGSDDPEVMGDTTIVSRTPVPRRVLAFGTWLDPDKAHTLEVAVERLRVHGGSFAMPLTTLAGRHVEVEGRAIGGRAVLRIKGLSGVKEELADLAAHHQKVVRDIDTVRTLLEALPSPIWARDAAGALAWANAAYGRAVDAPDGTSAVEHRLEILDSAAREEAERVRARGDAYGARLPVIVAGTRRILDVTDVPTRDGSAGIGIDVTEVAAMHDRLARMTEAHRRTLDQLATAVAIFDADHRLTFYNAAYRSLWGLSADFLDQGPTDSDVLERLRDARRLPEEVDFRKWRGALHEAYRALEAKEHAWYLPGGRTLRVVTTPNPEGGITYLFDDVTERLELARRYDALIRVQGETLEALAEAVAVFGSDGRLNLFNPAFAELWHLSPGALAERPHIETIIGWCTPLFSDDAAWAKLRAAVTALDHRDPVTGRLERSDGSIVDCATIPLPDGATLVTFQDVTASVNVERALTERADALVEADRLKSAFVQHVSYELRSPLTNIIGFAQLLDEPATGPLTDKQREYLGYINSSSSALLAIINDILDLATIDAGAMTLDLKPVDIRAAMEAAAEGVRDRLAENDLKLDIRAAPGIGSFMADERRVRQILFNLLSNAIGFSPAGATVTLAVERRDDAVVLSVTDSGPGIPAELGDRVFDRFETHSLGSRHRGAGLGLSIVRSFVELHGGTVTLDSAVGRGTTVTCVFPPEQARKRAAA